jgi:hypothetical protein
MLTEIFWFLTLPALIALSYFLTIWLVKKYEENTKK